MISQIMAQSSFIQMMIVKHLETFGFNKRSACLQEVIKALLTKKKIQP